MIYSLWDITTNNLLAEHDDLSAALALVRRGIERRGPHDTDSLSLHAEDESGAMRVIAHGEALAALARA